MRIQFGTWILSCDYVSYLVDSSLIGAYTTNGYYVIAFDNSEEAQVAYKQILEKGYYDASNNEYSSSNLIKAFGDAEINL